MLLEDDPERVHGITNRAPVQPCGCEPVAEVLEIRIREETLMNLMYSDDELSSLGEAEERATPEETARLERELEQAYGKDDDRGTAGYYPADFDSESETEQYVWEDDDEE